MKTIKMILASLVLTIAGMTTVSAQHSHDAPRGGVLQEAGGLHIEMVKSKDTLNFYFMDGSNKLVNKEISAEVKFEFVNQTTSTSKLAACKTGSLCTSLPKANIFDYCTLTFKVDGKTYTSKFKNTVSAAQRAHGHEH